MCVRVFMDGVFFVAVGHSGCWDNVTLGNRVERPKHFKQGLEQTFSCPKTPLFFKVSSTTDLRSSTPYINKSDARCAIDGSKTLIP